MTSASNLLSHSRPDDPIARWNDKLITRDEYLRDVDYVARHLPTARYALNMCQDRYFFLVAFAAVLVAKQTNLLPPNRSNAVLRNIIDDYGDCYYLSDEMRSDEVQEDQSLCQHQIRLPRLENVNEHSATATAPFSDAVTANIPSIASDHLAAITFTSGSTGRPQPNKKNWGGLVIGAVLAKSRFDINIDEAVSIIATVPPQHMYGLETSVMLTLLTGAVVYSGATFFPEDIRTAAEKMPEPCFLITTPVHLKICNEMLADLPAIKCIISATAPLSTHIAEVAEKKFNTSVMEIFGCTETGSIASRRTLDGDLWLLYDGFKIKQEKTKAYVSGAYLTEPVPLADLVEIEPDGRFKIIGRSMDLINIAGKRGSIADLNQKLLEIEGVQDGAFYLPDAVPDTVPGTDNTTQSAKMMRLVAFVVAPDLDEKKIIKSLSSMMDPVFLPRPLYKVNSLPRTESSKLPRSRLTEFYNVLRQVQ